MLTPPPKPAENPMLYELSSCLADMTKLLVRLSLYENKVQMFSRRDIYRLPEMISINGRKYCSIDVWRITDEEDGNAYINVAPIGKFASELAAINGRELQWLVMIDKFTHLITFSHYYEFEIVSSLSTLLNLENTEKRMLHDMVIVSETRYINAAMRASGDGLFF